MVIERSTSPPPEAVVPVVEAPKAPPQKKELPRLEAANELIAFEINHEAILGSS